MPAGPYWFFVQPVEKTTLLRNPSLERDATDWSSQTGAAVRASSAQAFGAWCYQIPTNSSGTLDMVVGTINAGVGTAYTASIYADAEAGKTLRVGLRTTGNYASGAWVGSSVNTTVAGMQRYSASYTEASGGGSRYLFAYIETASPTTAAFSVDGAQVEVGSITTYIDGDQEGCTWLGAPHASQSTRSGQSRAGGSVISLASIGFTVDESLGIGMPQVENSSQSFAIVPGAEFQRQRARERTITLTSYIVGSTWADLHQQRKNAINAFKIDAFTPQQPTRFWYTGASGTVQIDAVYDAGMEFGKPDGFEETVSVRFVAYDPYWRATTDEGTALASQVALGSARYIAYRDPVGRWGTFGANGSTFNGQVRCISQNVSGTLLLGGDWTTVAGTAYPTLAQIAPNGQLGTWTGGSVDGAVTTILPLISGTVFVGGNFASAGGTRAVAICQYVNGGFGTLSGGTLSGGQANALLYQPFGTLFIGGDFLKAAALVAPNLVMHRGGAYGTLNGQPGGTINGAVKSLALGLDGITTYFGGAFGSAGGSACNNIGKWRGAFGTLGRGLQPVSAGNDLAAAMGVGPNGILYAVGEFGSADGGTVANAATWNGAGWTGMGSGIASGVTSQSIYSVAIDPASGFTRVAHGGTVVGGIDFGAALFTAQWNGASWLPGDFMMPGASYTFAVLHQSQMSGTLYLGGDFTGTATAAALATVVNTGAAQVYPTLRMWNNSNGTARLYQFLNTTTNDGIYFNLVLTPQETVTLDLIPGERSFTSDVRNSVFGAILGGSNIATWRLLPGANTLSFFTDNTGVQASLYWRPTHWSADSGTMY